MTTGYGDMTYGLMCYNCGRIAQASDMFWNVVFECKGENKDRIIHVVCPECHHFGSCIDNVTFMVIRHKENEKK